ncbi:hypothetical protein D3C76_546470 [compost metagenome]
MARSATSGSMRPTAITGTVTDLRISAAQSMNAAGLCTSGASRKFTLRVVAA